MTGRALPARHLPAGVRRQAEPDGTEPARAVPRLRVGVPRRDGEGAGVPRLLRDGPRLQVRPGGGQGRLHDQLRVGRHRVGDHREPAGRRADARLPDCAYEEFFLTSFTVGDPAMLVDVPANMGLETLCRRDSRPPRRPGPKATYAIGAEDPANIHHSYTGDFAKIRNTHVGKEQHVFHLHNHQWLYNPNDDNWNYMDAQGIGPGVGYTLRDQLRRIGEPEQERRRLDLPLPLLPALRPGDVVPLAPPRRLRARDHPRGSSTNSLGRRRVGRRGITRRRGR